MFLLLDGFDSLLDDDESDEYPRSPAKPNP